MKYFDVMINDYNNILDTVRDILDDEAYDVAFQEGIEDLDIDDFLDGYADRGLKEFETKRETGVTLQTVDGYVHGHFIGSVEYPIAGDPVNGFETDRMLAFAADNGQIVGAFENNTRWQLYSLKKLGGIIHWDEYPVDWDVIMTRPKSIKKPAEKKSTKLSDFVDTPNRTDCGEFLYVVKSETGYEAYVGHNRKTAAKHIKILKKSGDSYHVTVYPVHRQDEYDTLPF